MPAMKIAFVTFPVLLALVSATPVRAQELRAWGGDGSGQVTGQPEGNFRGLAPGGASQGLAIRADGTLALWGGGGDPVAIPTVPADLARGRFRSGVVARTHAVVIRADQTLAAWGALPPIFPSFGHLDVPAGRFLEVAGGNRHSIGLAIDGRLHAWGANDVHQTDVPEGEFEAVAARVLYNIALRKDGSLVGWGLSPVPPFPASDGIFFGWAQNAGNPVHYFFEGDFTAIAAGNNHALAIRRHDGRVVGWGHNGGGALDAPDRAFEQIAAGSGFSVGIDTDGILWGWGMPANPPPPLPFFHWDFASAGWTPDGLGHYYVPGERFRSVSAAAFHVNAITVGADGAGGGGGAGD